ncbi:MAG: hypothetical protein AB7O59_24815 [Pirellulales bacterium]
MDQIVLLKIESLHARVVQPNGIKLRQKGKDIYTGMIAAYLDEAAGPAANHGLVNLTTGEIRLQWAIVATLPIMADAFAAGEVSEKESQPLRVSFDEAGVIPEGGDAFEAIGGGQVASGSLLSGARVMSQSNHMKRIPDRGDRVSLTQALARGKPVRCALTPESVLEIALPKSLGGGTQKLNLLGGFVLAPVMKMGGREAVRRKAR